MVRRRVGYALRLLQGHSLLPPTASPEQLSHVLVTSEEVQLPAKPAKSFGVAATEKSVCDAPSAETSVIVAKLEVEKSRPPTNVDRAQDL